MNKSVIEENGRISYFPENGQTFWAQAGYPGDIPEIKVNIINVKDQGALGDSITDDYSAIQAAIDNAPDPAVIFFPAGIYRINFWI